MRGELAPSDGRQLPELAREVGTGSALPAPDADLAVEVRQTPPDALHVGRPAAPPTLLQPQRRRRVPTLAVAPATRGQLVRRPGRAALHPRDEVIGRRWDQRGERTLAPHARRSVALED